MMLAAGDQDEVELQFQLILIIIVSALYHKLQKQCSAPEDGRNCRPKHVELIELLIKLLLLHLVGCLYYCISVARSHKHQI